MCKHHTLQHAPNIGMQKTFRVKHHTPHVRDMGMQNILCKTSRPHLTRDIEIIWILYHNYRI